MSPEPLYGEITYEPWMAEVLSDALEVDYDLSHHVEMEGPLSPGMRAVLRGVWDGRVLAEKDKPAQAPLPQNKNQKAPGAWFFVPQ